VADCTQDQVARTALDVAPLYGHAPVVKLLCATPGVHLGAVDNVGRAALSINTAILRAMLRLWRRCGSTSQRAGEPNVDDRACAFEVLLLAVLLDGGPGSSSIQATLRCLQLNSIMRQGCAYYPPLLAASCWSCSGGARGGRHVHSVVCTNG